MAETVFVDNHEPIEMINKILAMGYNVEIIPMGISDYRFHDCGIERKAGDFLNLGDVMTKAAELRSAFPKAFLLVEGDLGDLIFQSKRIYKKDLTQNILGMVASLSLQGIPPIFATNQFYLAGIMNKLFIKSIDGKIRVNDIAPLRPVAKNSDYQIRILSGMPNISTVLAERLIEKFVHIGNICKATIKELEEVPGIGKNKAETIKLYFHE